MPTTSSGITPKVQRVYHFVELEYGLDDLRRRRLKIAELMKLNDPFDFLGVNLANPKLRQAFQKMKNQISKCRGLLCFSRNWNNPLQWSHYAGKNTGLCLGFDIPSEHLGSVKYSAKRLSVDENLLRNPNEIDFDTAKALPFTKYSHWRYENEVRSFVTLDESDPATGLYFVYFSDHLKLVEVIVGAQSPVTEFQLLEALGDMKNSVRITKARPAFSSFRIVTQKNKKLWWPSPSDEH